MRLKGRGFDSRPLCFQITTVGKLFTRVCLCSPGSVNWYRPRGGDARGWEDGVTLAMRHRLQWFIQLRAPGLTKGDEHLAYTPHGVQHKFYAHSASAGVVVTRGGYSIFRPYSRRPQGRRDAPMG